jgi:hypothetical protein
MPYTRRELGGLALRGLSAATVAGRADWLGAGFSAEFADQRSGVIRGRGAGRSGIHAVRRSVGETE